MDIQNFKRSAIETGITNKIKWLGLCISHECDMLSSFIRTENESDKHIKAIDNYLCDIKALIEYRKNGDNIDNIRVAAMNLVDRWDSPLWGGSEDNIRHTSDFISDLRDALNAPAGSP